MVRYKREYNFNDKIIATVAYNVRKFRKLKGLTQEQLALDIEKSPEYLRKFESTLGSEGMSILTLYRISIVLGVRIDEFFKND